MMNTLVGEQTITLIIFAFKCKLVTHARINSIYERIL